MVAAMRGMSMAQHGRILRIVLCMIAATAFARPLLAADCPAKTFKDAAATIEACNLRLKTPALSADDRAQALVTRGRALHRSGQLDAAAVDYDQAITLASDPTDAHIW